MATSQTPRAVMEQIGEEYVESDTLPDENSATISMIYDELGRIVAGLFRQIDVPVLFQEADPYDDYQEMAETVGKEQQLRVYAGHTSHPELSHTEQVMFRAVHDWFGHLEADVDFSPEGEYKKCVHMRQYLKNGPLERVMFGEIVGQGGAGYYLPDGFVSDRFVQRACSAPDSWIADMRRAVRE